MKSVFASLFAFVFGILHIFSGAPVAALPATQPAAVAAAIPSHPEAAPVAASTQLPPPTFIKDKTPAPQGLVLGAQTTAPVGNAVVYTGVTEDELNQKITDLQNRLTTLIGAINTGTVGKGSYSTGGYTNNIALSNKIDQLSGTSLSNITVSGVSGLTDADIPNNITASNYLPITGASAMGSISLTDPSASSVASLGTERTTDGTFTSDPSSAWTLGSGWSWDSVNNRASHPAGTGSISLGNLQSDNFSPGTTGSILVVAAGSGYTNGDTITISGGSGDATYTVTVGSGGKVTGLTPVSRGTAYTAGVGLATTGGTGTGLLVSIFQIDDAAALSQVITTSASDPTTTYLARDAGATISGPTYNVSFTIKNYTGLGSVKVDIGSVAKDMYPYPTYYYQANGTYTILLTSTSSLLTFTPTADFAGAITNVSVKPVIPANAIASFKNTDGSTALEIRSGGIIKYNTFIGTGAGQNNTTGGISGPGSYSISVDEGRNTGVGFQSLYSNTTGGDNTAYGAYSLFSNTTGGGNTALSYDSMYANTTGFNNTAVGASSLWANTTGGGNTALGTTALHYNTTGSSNTAVGSAALYSNTTGVRNTSIGFSSLLINTTGTDNTAIGYLAAQSTSIGSGNVALGAWTMRFNTTGNNNTALGGSALQLNITGSSNVAVGTVALPTNVSGSNNAAVGYNSMLFATSSNNTVAFGYQAGRGTASYSNQGGTYLGYQTGYQASSGSDYNILVGYQAGNSITTGSNNIWIGTATSAPTISNLTTGSQNILIGNNISLPSATNSGQLDIGNILYGTGITGVGSTLSTGNIGIGTVSPYSRLQIKGTDSASSTSSFAVVSSASTTVFAVFNGGNAQLSGTLTQSSDRRLKTNINTLDASSSLAAINQLQPVAYDWLDPEKGGVRQFGFIAQDVQQVFPNLVATTSATALTPDGTLGLNYMGLIAPLVEAVQNLSSRVMALEAAVAGFADKFTTNEADVGKLCAKKSDGTQVCVSGDKLADILSGQSSSSNTSTVPTVTVSDPTPPIISGTSTPPTIKIQGDNPAVLHLNDTYTDLGAIVTDSQGNSLGYKTFLNGTFVSSLVIDTTGIATDTVDYVSTDTWGNTSTSTRTVIVQ